MATRLDYTPQADGYDRTRGASPSILRPLTALLASAPGPSLLDVGGGTGNYAAALREAGYEPLVLDVSASMLVRAAAKNLPVVRADATDLPVAPASLDAVTVISVLHLVPDWRRALAEARRVLRRGGRLALMLYARENLGTLWVLDYLPGSRDWMVPDHQSIGDLLRELPGAEVIPFEFSDLSDASLSVLCRHPHLLLDPAYRAQTSFFRRLERLDPEGMRAGLARLADDLAAGRRPDVEVAGLRARYGDGTVIGWTAP